MSSIILNGDTSGSVTVSAPSVAGTQTVTLPVASGVLQVSGNMPAFSAYLNVDQTLTTSVSTKVQYGVEQFDTNNNYDSTTNYRFTPTVAGYYQVNGSMQIQGASSGLYQYSIYKNGSRYFQICGLASNTSVNPSVSGGAVIYMNGSTDYLEMYAYQNSGGNLVLYGLGSNGGNNFFSASLVRAA